MNRMSSFCCLPCNYDKMTRIVKAELGNDAGVIGAALLGKNKRII